MHQISQQRMNSFHNQSRAISHETIYSSGCLLMPHQFPFHKTNQVVHPCCKSYKRIQIPKPSTWFPVINCLGCIYPLQWYVTIEYLSSCVGCSNCFLFPEIRLDIILIELLRLKGFISSFLYFVRAFFSTQMHVRGRTASCCRKFALILSHVHNHVQLKLSPAASPAADFFLHLALYELNL